MKVAIYLNLAALYPVAELHAIQKNQINKKDRVVLFANSNQNIHNHSNPFGRYASYLYERNRIKNISSFFKNSKIQFLNFDQKLKQKLSSIDKNTLNKIEFSVKSSFSGYLRTSQSVYYSRSWQKAFNKIFINSQLIYLYFLENLKEFDEIRLFNGRFCEDRPCILASKKLKKKIVVYDISRNKKYVEFKSSKIWDENQNLKNAKNIFFKNKNFHTIRQINDFFLSKFNSLDTFEKSFTKNQIKGFTSFTNNKQKTIISIFPSSDDEQKFLFYEKESESLSQFEEIKNLCNLLNHDCNYSIIIRMHPNMRWMNKNEIANYHSLKLLKNVTYLEPNSKDSTYHLISLSDYVVTFGSSVAVEATYMGKKVINIGKSYFSSFKVANFVKNHVEAVNLIKQNNVKIQSKRASTLWFYYLGHFYTPNKSLNLVKQNQNNIFYKHSFNFIFKTTLLLKIIIFLRYFDRIEIAAKSVYSIDKSLIFRFIYQRIIVSLKSKKN